MSKEILYHETHHPQPHDRRWLNFVTLCLLLALSVCIITVAAAWPTLTGAAAAPDIDPTAWATLTLWPCGGAGQPVCPPTAVGTWHKVVATATPTPTGTPGDLIYPPVPSATPGIQLTVVVTGAVPITPPGPMPTQAEWCGTPPEWVHRWTCINGKLIEIGVVYLPLVRAGR